LPPRSKDRIIARGQRQIDRMINEMEKTLPAIPDKPWDAQSDGEFWGGNFRQAMYFQRRVLDRPDDWDDIELMKMKKEVSLAVTAQTVRLKAAELQPPRGEDVVAKLLQGVAAMRRGETLTAAKMVEHQAAAAEGEPEAPSQLTDG
jgi:hypothetical protein